MTVIDTTKKAFKLDRRQLLVGSLATAAAVAMGTRGAVAQPRLSTPNLIREGTLVMSMNPTLPPLQFVDSTGELQGMRVELGKEIAKTLGLVPEYIRVEFAVTVPGLAARRWDMINTGIYWTEERSKIMYMVPYERAAVSFLVARGNPLNINTWKDMGTRSVGVEMGGIEEQRTREVDAMLKAEGLPGLDIRIFNNFADAFQALRVGQIDAATSIDATASYWQDRGDFTRGVAGLFPQDATFAFSDKTVADEVVNALNELKASGYYDELFNRYGVLKIEEDAFAIRGPGPAAA